MFVENFQHFKMMGYVSLKMILHNDVLNIHNNVRNRSTGMLGVQKSLCVFAKEKEAEGRPILKLSNVRLRGMKRHLKICNSVSGRGLQFLNQCIIHMLQCRYKNTDIHYNFKLKNTIINNYAQFNCTLKNVCFFYEMFPEFRKNTNFSKVPRLQSFF